MLENLEKSLKFCEQLSKSEQSKRKGLTFNISLIQILARKEEQQNFQEIETLEKIFQV